MVIDVGVNDPLFEYCRLHYGKFRDETYGND